MEFWQPGCIMKVLTDKRIKTLFFEMIVCSLGFTVIAILLLVFLPENGEIYIVVCAVCMAFLFLVFCYRFFKEQNRILEEAVEQISKYIAGNDAARIACNEEGELYRLFHEVNSLAAILHAHTQKEQQSKTFLKHTIADISHQLKTPLAALNIYNGILKEEAKEGSAIWEFTNLSEQELDRIEALVQMLLKITKLDAGSVVLEKNNENLSEIVKQVQKHFAYHFTKEEKEIHLTGNQALLILCDRGWFVEALDNIVKNALDHTQKGDSIWISWKQFASIVQITIKDNGGGIHPEDLPHIFKRFYRSKFSKDTQGIGLGLSLAKAIVEAHGGTIEVDSALNVGTTFVINLQNCRLKVI